VNLALGSKMKILSIQGCTAVGKTSIIQKFVELNIDWSPIYENISEIRKQSKLIGSDDGTAEYFWKNQKVFLDHELELLNSLNDSGNYIWDNRLEQICFYCEKDPRGNKILPEYIKTLMNQIYQVPKFTIYLDDTLENIKMKKVNDLSRKRNGFDNFINTLLKDHKKWHVNHGAVVVNVGEKNTDSICIRIKELYEMQPTRALKQTLKNRALFSSALCMKKNNMTIENPFENSWKVTKDHFKNAVDLLPEKLIKGDEGAGIEEYFNCLSHNELELALNELEFIGEANNVSVKFWNELLLAAENMGLKKDVSRFNQIINKGSA
jgi:hypothetical protein